MKPHNLTVKGNQAPALCSNTEVWCKSVGQSQDAVSHRHLAGIFLFFTILLFQVSSHSLANSASLSVSHCHDCEKAVAAVGCAHML